MRAALFGRRSRMPLPFMDELDPTGQGQGPAGVMPPEPAPVPPPQRPGMFGGRARGILRREDGDPGTFANYLLFGSNGVQGMRDSAMNQQLFGVRMRGMKLEEQQARQERAAREAAIAALPPEQQVFARANLDPFVEAQAPLSAEERAQIDFRERQFEETARHNRTSEAIDWTRASREGRDGIPTLAEARQWTNSYNDDVRTVMNDLGNMRSAIPYAQRVLQTPQGQLPAGNVRMNDVALLRAAARAQTGPGVLTETEVFGTLSPSLRQDLIRARSYADIAQTGLDPDDRRALAQYVQMSARNASGDLWRRYSDAENVLSSRGVPPSSVGISAPEYLHPEDMDSFGSVPESNYRRGRSYVAPSGRRYEYLGSGRFRYTGSEQYDRSRVTVNRPQAGAQGEAPPAGIDPTEWANMTPQERQRVREITSR